MKFRYIALLMALAAIVGAWLYGFGVIVFLVFGFLVGMRALLIIQEDAKVE